MEFRSTTKISTFKTYTPKVDKSEIVLKSFRKLPDSGLRFLSNPPPIAPVQSYDDFKNHLLGSADPFFKPQSFKNMPIQFQSGNINMTIRETPATLCKKEQKNSLFTGCLNMRIGEMPKESKMEKAPPAELYQTIMEKRNEAVRQKLFPIIHKKYQKAVKKLQDISGNISNRRKSDESDKERLIKHIRKEKSALIT